MDSDTKHMVSRWSRELKASDRDAFRNIFDHFYSMLLAYATRILESRESAKDVVQEAFITLWNQRDSVDPGKCLKSFLYRIVYTRCLNHIRDRRLVGMDEESFENLLVPDEIEHDMMKEDSGIQEVLAKMVSRLPERQREALLLSRQDGLTHDEIAVIMECKPATVNNHITGAMKNLRIYLKDLNIEGYQ
ncbi:MAG: RNA polymerase sigma factor [Cyclonatronaceae bacterium]